MVQHKIDYYAAAERVTNKIEVFETKLFDQPFNVRQVVDFLMDIRRPSGIRKVYLDRSEAILQRRDGRASNSAIDAAAM
jgi:hypothetical protein